MNQIFRVAASAISLWSSTAFGQSDPGLTYGQVPTADQWNSYFAAKQDYLGYTPLNLAGGVLTGPLITTPSTTSAAGLNVPPGSAPTAPNNGDIWVTSAGLFVRINGTTVGPLVSAVSGVVASLNSLVGNLSIAAGSGMSVTPSGSTITVAQSLTNATFQSGPLAPTGTTSTSFVNMGLGTTCKLTPVYSTRIFLQFIGNAFNTATDQYIAIQASFGTGTAPSNGVAATGTQVGLTVFPTSPSGSATEPFTAGGIITGLTPGTPYWFDLRIAAQSNTATVQGTVCTAIEF